LISLRTLLRDKTLRGLASSNGAFPAAGREGRRDLRSLLNEGLATDGNRARA
jgi:hypothetical protein